MQRVLEHSRNALVCVHFYCIPALCACISTSIQHFYACISIVHFYCALLSIGLLSIGLLSLRLYGIRISTHTHMHTYTHAHAHPHNNYASQLAAHTYNYASQLAAHTYNWSILGSPKCLQNRFNHQTNLQTSLVDSCMFCFVLVWG